MLLKKLSLAPDDLSDTDEVRCLNQLATEYLKVAAKDELSETKSDFKKADRM